MIKPLYLCNQDYFISPLNTVTVEKRENQVAFPRHYHEFYELVIVSAGNGMHSWNDETHPITCGDVLYINSDDIHSYQSVNQLQLNNILYQRELLSISAVIEQYLPHKSLPQAERFWRIHPSFLKQISLLTEQLQVESKKNNMSSIHLSESLLLQLVILLHRFRYQPNTNFPAPTHQLDILFTVLHNSIARSFNLEHFCQQQKIPSRSLIRIFKNQTGMTITEYLQQLKAAKAMNLLRNTQYSISIIANECGYEDSNYFSAVFRKIANQTPSQYRAKFHHKKNRGLVTPR
ncbi:helix-turn-helix domain-containing protein [Orbus mooreae]|uniref:helix-turn-helix domain-containing protein n=1 Tax=Orbus mooreae TaxID=3074107 RepID=UPI00370D8BA5